jgi:hypothetical protein
LTSQRRFDRGQNGDCEQSAGGRGDRKHRSPSFGAGKRLVHEISEKDADRDRQLIGRNESPPLRGRREFGRVERGRDGGDANAEAGDEPAKNENRNVRRRRLDRRADDEQRRGGEERALAAEMVGDIAAAERSEHGPERYPAGHDLKRGRADRKRLLDANERARDDALIVAEEGAGEHHHRNDACGAGGWKSIGDRIGAGAA